MRIIKRMLIACLCIVISTSLCYAETIERNLEREVTPFYLSAKSISESFSINSSGVASMEVGLKPLNNTIIDQVKVTLSIKKVGGSTVYNKTFTTSWDNLFSRYELAKTYQLTSRGNYSFKATYQCYKNNSLVETITSDAIVDSY